MYTQNYRPAIKIDTAPLIALLSTFVTACAAERIDAIIDGHGVTSGEDDATHPGEDKSTGIFTTTGDPDGETTPGLVSTGPGSTASTTLDEQADTTGHTGSSGSTGSTGPICGDGIVEGDEGCDDGNDLDDDGCRQCARDSVVFISSEVYQGFALGGLYGADQRCRGLAAKAGLLRFETFRAWLSTPSETVADRFVHGSGRYVLVNGLVVADDWTALAAGDLVNPITVDEHSQTQETRVWTGTLADGRAAPASDFCGEWDDDSGLLLHGGEGRSVVTDAGWSFYEDGGCGSENHIYCFEQ